MSGCVQNPTGGLCDKSRLCDSGSALGGTDAVIGAIIAIIASIGSNIGVNLQGHAQTLLKEGQHYTKLPIWWCGMGLVVLGSVGDFVALGFATQALVAALGGATTLSTNLLIARFWKNQDINPLDGIGVVFIVAGAVIIAVKTPSSNNYSLQDMNQCVRASEFPRLTPSGVMRKMYAHATT